MDEQYTEIVESLQYFARIVDSGYEEFDLDELNCMIYGDMRALETSRERANSLSSVGTGWATLHEVLVALKAILNKSPRHVVLARVQKSDAWPKLSQQIRQLPLQIL